MTKSFYIILTGITTFIVLFLMGQWIGRSYSLTEEQLIRQIHESFSHTAEQYETDSTQTFPALFRKELDKRHLDKLIFRIDTVSLNDPDIVQREDIRYFSDYKQLFSKQRTFTYPINDTQGVQAYIVNPRAGSIGRLLYFSSVQPLHWAYFCSVSGSRSASSNARMKSHAYGKTFPMR